MSSKLYENSFCNLLIYTTSFYKYICEQNKQSFMHLTIDIFLREHLGSET